ncbi:Ankyrin-2 [Phytophthora ramorum]|uniref:Ankyrin-2 n=1 Tax=Phytophthora ramorum TaxID=164328 RepID=UPI00309E60AE|nr:Ankyrin-2 [Phytophthora ramorum]
MGEEAAATGSRPGSSTAKNREAAKKRAALWKKQLKSFKLKDVGKKVDAVRFCAQDERFFRDQAEVLPLLMGFLTRTKTPELVMETLAVMHVLLSPSITTETDSEVIHPDINAGFILERSMSADSAWKAGEPFINLFSMSTLAPEIRIKAIQVYDLLLRASVALSAAAGEASPTMLQFQSAGFPCSALLGCLSAESGDLQFSALSGLRSLMRNPPNEDFLSKFEAEKGISRSLEFVVHSERRYHRPALDIIESFSHFECGRQYLKANGALSVLRNAIQEAQQTMQKTSSTVPVSGVDSSPLSAKDAPLLCSNIGVSCQVFVRMTLAREQANRHVEDDRTLFVDAIDAMVAILQYDITRALTPVAPTESPRTTGGAAAIAAANAAAANAAALASLFPFSIDRSVAVISSLGRMVEFSEHCKAHAKAKGLLSVLLDCYKVKNADNLHQVADKLLHLCIHIGNDPDPRSFLNGTEPEAVDKQQEHEAAPDHVTTRIDPQILCAVATGDAELSVLDTNVPESAVSPTTNGENPPLVSVETLLALLEASHETVDKALIFRHVRWVAALVELPGNANALGERAVTLFLQILTTTSDDRLLFAFLAKCIKAIVLQSAGALELCGSSGHEPSTSFLKFLQETSSCSDEIPHGSTATEDTTFLSQPIEENPSEAEQPGEVKSEQKPVADQCKLEWIDEYEEEAAFEPRPLTETCHDVDAFLSVAEALTGLTTAFLKWNPTGNGSIATDFSELIAAKLEGKHGIPAAAAGSKKKLASDQTKASVVGEAVMLCILEKGMQVPKLVSKYAAVNPTVCVSLLTLLNNMLTVPSGLKVLLSLAKAEMQSTPSGDQVETSASADLVGEWPLSVEASSRMEHTLLLSPVLNVLQSPDTTFIEIEAAIKAVAVMASDLEPVDKEPPASAPEPVVEAAKSPAKGGAAVSAPPGAPTIPEPVIADSDLFINVALGSGALVLLLSFLDYARIPRGPEAFPARVDIMKTQIEGMVMKFITLAQEKQESLLTKYREKLELEQPPTTETASAENSVDLNLPYQGRWAQVLLDHKVSVPRFGYVSYSALLLASELALPKLVTALLNAGASSETSSPEGVTPLMIAFLVGKEEMVIDLLDARANVDAITNDGQDLTVWNCALVSPLKVRVSTLITKAYMSSEAFEVISTSSSRVQLDSIEGSLQFLDMCLDAGVDANVSNAHGDFLLHALLSKTIVRRKLRGLDLCFRYYSYYEDERRLKRAVVDLIEAHSANVNSYNHMGQTPLHLALLHGYPAIAKILISRGANPNVQGVYGHLPLHYACLGFCGNLDGSDGEAIGIIQTLLEQATKHPCILGVHADRRKHKTTAQKQALAIESILENDLHSVVEPQFITQKLASAQQIITTASFLGKFLPWHFACGAYVQLSSVLCLDDDMQKWFEANGQARADILRYFIREWKIDISATASDGVTALHLAVKSDVNDNNVPVVDLLLENCGDGAKSSSLLNVNAVHEHIFIDCLPAVPNGAQTVLLDATHDGKLAYVSARSIDGKYHIILIDGRHLDDVPRDQLQVIYDPEKKGSHHSHHYKYLLPMESRFSALHYALQSNHDTLALRLLALSTISLDPEGSDLPLLALACAARQTPEVVGRLITQQANMRVHLPLRTSKCDLTAIDVDTSSSIANRKHAAALHYAVMYDDVAMVKVLLTSPGGHVHPNVRRSRDGFTPLHLACQLEEVKIAKLLLEHGASLTLLSSMSAQGVSPLQLLMKFDSLENDKLKTLISENYLRPEMLLEGFFEQQESRSENQPGEDQNNDSDENDTPSCVLLHEEEHNLDLFKRLQGLNRDKRGNYEALTRRLEMKLEKSDAVLRLFFDLLRQVMDPVETPVEADVQEKVKLQQQERKQLTTKLAMENSMQQDLSTQLQQLERELSQLHLRHAYNRAEIEGERRAVQRLEKDYASLTEQEQELQRDCEVMELQLDTQRTQLKEIRSQQLYLDFVSSAPLKRHMEEKKWQEQHAAVALQVQNAEAENRALEDETRNLDHEASTLEAQYACDVQTKQQSETALSEIRANYEQYLESFERTRVCYTPRPDWDRIVNETPELSVQKYQWEMAENSNSREVMTSATEESSDKDNGGVLERIGERRNTTVVGEDVHQRSKGRTKALVKEMLHWIERLQKHCGVNLHLSRIWHDVEEARVELNILHHQLDRAVRKTSILPIAFPNASGVITIAAAGSPTSSSPSKRRQDYIMALGMHEGIPMFLRHRGKLKRRVLKKIDVEKVVRKVWVEKRKREQRNPLGRFPLEQVLYEKLHRKYGFQPLIAEWGYNLLLALQMFSWDSEIEMFLLCLTGAVSDLVYVDQEQMIQGCQQLLLRLCELYAVESFVTERRVLLKDALVALRTYFPLKTSAQLQAIEQAIIRDMHKMKRGGNDSILYIEDILPLDAKYPLGFFVKTIRTQHFKEIQDYYGLLLG